MLRTHHSQFFRTAAWLSKYFLLATFGFTTFVSLTGTLGASQFAWMILWLVGPWIVRLGIFVGCVMGVAVVVESVRY